MPERQRGWMVSPLAFQAYVGSSPNSPHHSLCIEPLFQRFRCRVSCWKAWKRWALQIASAVSIHFILRSQVGIISEKTL
jgi:hypothetical protein